MFLNLLTFLNLECYLWILEILKSSLELFWVMFLGTFVGYLNRKWIWEKESNLGELGLENKEGTSWQNMWTYSSGLKRFPCFTEWSQTFFVENYSHEHKFEYISPSQTCFKAVISWSFIMFNCFKKLSNLMRCFLSQITILDTIIKFKD